jgi:putative membrane protein|tara:strand:+ start:277 stop:690 length:414 start_codon:yes stop_codon:yes gene_type:complete
MLWIKAFHIIFMVTWFAGLFYLPRLFVYHAMSTDKLSNDRFIIMERKLLFGIMTPGGILTIIFGIWLWLGYGYNGTWLWLKILCVIALILYHIYCIKFFNQFKKNINTRSHIFYRWFNEVPVILLILITLLVVIRPF